MPGGSFPFPGGVLAVGGFFAAGAAPSAGGVAVAAGSDMFLFGVLKRRLIKL